MPEVLVVGGTVDCSHMGSGPITSGSSKLTVGGMAAVVSGQEESVPFIAPICPQLNPAQTSPAPCTMTKAATMGGVSTKLTVVGKGAILSNAKGLTDNSVWPTSTWSVSKAGQSKLTVSS